MAKDARTPGVPSRRRQEQAMELAAVGGSLSLVCAMLGVPKRTYYRMIADGRLTHINFERAKAHGKLAKAMFNIAMDTAEDSRVRLMAMKEYGDRWEKDGDWWDEQTASTEEQSAFLAAALDDAEVVQPDTPDTPDTPDIADILRGAGYGVADGKDAVMDAIYNPDAPGPGK